MLNHTFQKSYRSDFSHYTHSVSLSDSVSIKIVADIREAFLEEIRLKGIRLRLSLLRNIFPSLPFSYLFLPTQRTPHEELSSHTPCTSVIEPYTPLCK